jgi:hypothetical protein
LVILNLNRRRNIRAGRGKKGRAHTTKTPFSLWG